MSSLILSISNSLQLPYDEARLSVTMVLSIILGIINHQIKSIKIRLIFNLINGLILQYVGYGISGILNISSSAIITYLFMKYFGRKVSAFVLLIYTLLHLGCLNIYRKYFCELSWTISFSDVIYMMTLVKYTSLAFSYEDGALDDKFIHNEHLINHKVVELPSLLEVLSFVYFYPTTIIGPGFEFTDFKDFIELKGHYKSMTPKIAIKYGFIRLCYFFMYIAIYSFLSNAYPIIYLTTEEYGQKNIFYKIYFLFLSMAGYRTKFYSGFNCIFMAMVFTGISYQEIREKKKNDDNEKKVPKFTFTIGEFGNPLIIEFGLNPKDKIANWNRTVHLWLKYNVYIRLIRCNNPIFKDNSIIASLMTFIVSAFWHGFYISFYLFFLLFFVINIANERFEKLGFYKRLYSSNIFVKICAWFIIQFIVNGLVVIFANLHYEKLLAFMKNIYWLPIILVFLFDIVSYLLTISYKIKKKKIIA